MDNSLKFAFGARVQTPQGAGTVVDDHAAQHERHNGAWPRLYAVQVDSGVPNKKGAQLAFHESELSALESPPATS